MSKTDHLARAKDYIAKGDEFYAKAADEIAAWLEEDGVRTQAQAAERLEISEQQVYRILRARREGSPRPDWGSGSNKRDDVTRKVLGEADEQTVEEIVAALPAKAVERIVKTGTVRLVENARAARAEHNVEPTADDLMGGERFDPAEFWADTLIIRANRNLRELESLTKRGGGVRFGTMPLEEALDYAQDTERLAAEYRAAVQELVRDQKAVV